MEIVTVILSTPLFTSEGSSLPKGIVSILGRLLDSSAGGISIQATNYQDGKGRELDGAPTTLFIPMHKVDHVIHG